MMGGLAQPLPFPKDPPTRLVNDPVYLLYLDGCVYTTNSSANLRALYDFPTYFCDRDNYRATGKCQWRVPTE